MSRWQIATLYLYSHDGRRLELPFELSRVNILVGVSYSGKSALVEVIDYCLGASQCHIPGVVREATSWVGVLWRRDHSDILVCRRVPMPGQGQSSEEVYFAVGSPVEVPATSTALSGNTNRNGGLRQFEQALHMGDVTGETFTERQGERVSFRNAVPYLLQSDDVIVNKMTLLRGANDERRTGIADALPYFLGAVNEATSRAETRLRTLRSQREREARRVEVAGRTVGRDRERSLALLAEAAQLRMIDPPSPDAPPDVIHALLHRVAGWTTSPAAGVEADQLAALYAAERELRHQYATARRQLDAATAMVESADGFAAAVGRQRQRLDVVELFRPGGGRDTCPVCAGDIGSRTVPLARIEEALERLNAELAAVGLDRPKVDRYANRLTEELAQTGRELEAIRGRIAAVVSEAELTRDRLTLDERQIRVAGRVSYHLEEAEAATEVSREQLDRLDAQIGELELTANPEAKAERLDILQGQVSIHASEILRELPFDPNYRPCNITFNARRLDIRFVCGPRVMEMRDVGGDESYLSGHVATLLALHRVFADGDRPVPGVIVFDQLSRPFFPADRFQDEVAVRGDDRTDLKSYFDVLFAEVEARKTLQVIVLEHAYFADDVRYTQAVRARWTHGERLIPADWPKNAGVDGSAGGSIPLAPNGAPPPTA